MRASRKLAFGWSGPAAPFGSARLCLASAWCQGEAYFVFPSVSSACSPAARAGLSQARKELQLGRKEVLLGSICRAQANFLQDEASDGFGEDGSVRLDLTVTSKDIAAARGAGGGSRALRLDAFLAGALTSGQTGSRSKAQAAIRSGGVVVNGKVVSKASATLAAGDTVQAVLEPAPLLQALPEPIPLDVVYEDEHLMVINKPSGMAVHVSTGHHTNTLVNALLFHCGLPGVRADADAPHQGVDVLLPDPTSTQGSSPGNAPHTPAALLRNRCAAQATQGEGMLHAAGDGVGYSLDGLKGLVEGGRRRPGHASGGHPLEKPLGIQSVSAGSIVASGGQHDGGEDLGGDDEDKEVEEEEDGEEEEEGTRGGDALNAGRGPGGGRSLSSSSSSSSSSAASGILRPGIVHRLDIGTSGLIVVAKREAAQRHLAAQFKARTVSRLYTSITLGCPRDIQGRVLTNIDRDASDRKRMAAYPYGGSRGRVAASNYRVLSIEAGGGAAVVEWKLDTGRTHQIRVHARHLGHPLLCDATYGGGGAAALNTLTRNKSSRQSIARQVLAGLARPALHARTLAFDHPVTGDRLEFQVDPPQDMLSTLELLKGSCWT